jgi:hypothetical protein
MTLVSGLHELRLQNDALISLSLPPTWDMTGNVAAETCPSSCAEIGGGAYSPKSILLRKNDLDISMVTSGGTSPSASQREEKKEEEFEVYVPRDDPSFASVGGTLSNVGIGEMSSTSHSLKVSKSPSEPTKSASKAMEIMRTTISSISPSPLSGWCGSALMCISCRRVRPIQNAPFLDIPIVPTSVSHWQGTREPPCRLEECLEEFTNIERVHDVECKNCTLKAEIEMHESEKKVHEQIIRGLLARRAKRRASTGVALDASQESEHLRDELVVIESRLDALRKVSPDDDGPLFAMARNDGIDDDGVTEHIQLKRSDAFKCLLLTRLPSVLSIHVQRRYYDQKTGHTSKTMQRVIFPEILDVAPYCAYGGTLRPDALFAGTTNGKYSSDAELNAAILYTLQSIIEHQGGPYSGHYVCYRRDPSAIGRWLGISDDTVKVCTWPTVQNCQAYMLFYEAM